MANPKPTPRENQRLRTRKDLLDAATRLVKLGQMPSLDQIAEAAMVSRATAYRYFSSAEAILSEMTLDVAMPDAGILKDADPVEPAKRVEFIDRAVQQMIDANETALRVMLIHTLQFRLKHEGDALPARQNRRTPLIEAALAPAADRFAPGSQDLLAKALGLVIGTEATIAFKDVLGLSDAEAKRVKRWMIRALVDAARIPDLIEG